MTRKAPRLSAGRRLWALLALVIVGVLLVAPVVRIAYRGQALPGTAIAGVPVGGQTDDAIKRRLTRTRRPPMRVKLTGAGRTLTVTPGQVGYRINVSATARRALDAGRHGLLAGGPATVRGLFTTRSLNVIEQVDEQRLDRAVARAARTFGRRPFPGALRFTAADPAITPDPPRPGRRVDRPRLRRLLLHAFATGTSTTTPVPLRVTPPPSAAAVAQVAARADRYVMAPLTLAGAGAPITVTAAQLRHVLTLSTSGGRPLLGTTPGALRELVTQIKQHADRPGISARVTAPASGPILSDKGDVSWRPRPARVTVTGGRPGRMIDPAAAAAAITRAITAGRHQARLQTVPAPAAVTARQARRITALIGTFTTMYVPGQPRVQNIRRIARAVDGTLIPAGGQFSLNKIAGQRTRAKGYVPAPFIAEGNTLEPSVGGGVSQASTTIYNAAYFAGLQIDSHTPHSVYIPRYPAGRESTLNYGSIELLWTNDTRAPILVRATTTPTSITVRLYGNNGGRRVRATSSPRRPVPGGDFAVTVTRTIRYPGGRTVRQPFTTSYGIEQPSTP